MTQWQLRSGRKKTGGLLRRHRKKKRYQRGRDFVPAHVGELKMHGKRARGGSLKRIVLKANIANVLVKGRAQKTKITSVLENKADLQFVRRNIITRGAIVQTELGKARVTSRPGQDGVVNAVLVEPTPKASSGPEEK